MSTDPNHDLLRLGGITEGGFAPAIGLTKDLRCHAQTGHRGVAGESDQRSSTFTRGTGKTDGLGALGFDAGDHYQGKPPTSQKLLCATQAVLSVARSDENRTFFPERTSNSSKSVDPNRSLTLSDGGVTRCPQYCSCSALRHPYSQSAAWQSSSGKNRIERIDSCRDRFRCPVRNWGGIGKALLDECANGGIAVGHGSAE